tara:strand:- start:195 stop:920 length:726 start_codon:yes stop_codon:yes gene_type:complete
MQAVILAAGHGSRLSKPLNLKPKTLLKVKNKTIIYLIIEKLIQCKIKKITIIVGFKKNLLKQYIIEKFKKSCQINFINNRFFKTRGNLFSVSLLKNKIKDDVIIFNADLIFDKKILQNFINKKDKNLFLTNKKIYMNKDDICFVYKKDKIVTKVYVKEKANKEKQILPAAGIVKMEKKTFQDYIKIINRKNLIKEKYYEQGYKDIIKKNNFKVFEAKKRVIEIDKRKDYLNFLKSNYYKLL